MCRDQLELNILSILTIIDWQFSQQQDLKVSFVTQPTQSSNRTNASQFVLTECTVKVVWGCCFFYTSIFG